MKTKPTAKALDNKKDKIAVKKISKTELLLLKDKYIFHGSHALFDVCKPHQAKCETKRKENEQFAIYGSSSLEFAILFAFEKLPKTKYSWSADVGDDGKPFGLLKEGTYIAEEDFGFIYCFDKAKFKPTTAGSMQYVCKQELAPVAIYKVYYKDFKELFEIETATKTV